MSRVRHHGSRWMIAGVAVATTAVTLVAPAGAEPAVPDEPVKVIYDTDFGGDVDDAGVAAMLNAMQDNGEAEVLAMITSNPTSWAAPGLDAINTYYRNGSIPIGALQPVDDDATHNVSGYAEHLAKFYPNNLRHGSNAPEAVSLYREILAEQDTDDNVKIAVVGGQTNVAALLDTGPDRHSSLTGAELVAQKVDQLVVMGAEFPTGFEWNIRLDPAAADQVAREWPTPVIYSGFEVGETVYTGERVFFETPEGNPVRAAYELYVGFGNDRNSWDQTAAYYAVRGGDGLFTLSDPGVVHFGPDGSNTWSFQDDGNHQYLIKTQPDQVIADKLEDLMVQLPKKGPYRAH